MRPNNIDTEPDFSDDQELKLSPDSERFFHRIIKARVKGDHETELLEAQKLLFLSRRDGEKDFFPDYLGIVSRAWEALGHFDKAASYKEEAFLQVINRPPFPEEKIVNLVSELIVLYQKMGAEDKVKYLCDSHPDYAAKASS